MSLMVHKPEIKLQNWVLLSAQAKQLVSKEGQAPNTCLQYILVWKDLVFYYLEAFKRQMYSFALIFPQHD